MGVEGAIDCPPGAVMRSQCQTAPSDANKVLTESDRPGMGGVYGTSMLQAYLGAAPTWTVFTYPCAQFDAMIECGGKSKVAADNASAWVTLYALYVGSSLTVAWRIKNEAGDVVASNLTGQVIATTATVRIPSTVVDVTKLVDGPQNYTVEFQRVAGANIAIGALGFRVPLKNA